MFFLFALQRLPVALVPLQEWLEQVSKKYTVSKLSLLKNKINADFKAGKLDEDKLRDMDLIDRAKYNLNDRVEMIVQEV